MRAADAADGGDAGALVDAIADSLDGLATLGDAAGVPIVPSPLRSLGPLARTTEGAFTMSGAGGGDVAVYIGSRPPSEAFEVEARKRGLANVPVAIDHRGVRLFAEPT